MVAAEAEVTLAEAVQFDDHGLKAAIHVDPMIGVTNRRVELCKELTVFVQHDRYLM